MMADLLGRFLTSIKSQHHGGTVAILQDGPVDGLEIRYPASSNVMTESPKRYAEIVHEQSLARIRLQELEDIDDMDRKKLMLAYMYNPAGWDGLVATYDAVAAFANTDGAVILNRDLSLRGFGAIVDIRPPAHLETLSLRGEDGESITEDHILASTGTRHLSALRLAQRATEGIVFVFSADGEVRAFCREGNIVQYFRDFCW
jgi:hypothetical protein